MAMKTRKQSIVGGVGALFIGAALILYVVSIFFDSLRNSNFFTGANNTISAKANTSIDNLLNMLNACIILFGMLGITMIGGAILAYVTGIF